MKISRCMNPSGHRVTGSERKKSFKKNIDYHYTKKYVIVNVQYQICFEKKLIGAVRGGTYGKDVADVKKRRLRTPGKKKICFTASCGGHMEQLMMLAPLMKEFESFIVCTHTLNAHRLNTHTVDTRHSEFGKSDSIFFCQFSGIHD